MIKFNYVTSLVGAWLAVTNLAAIMLVLPDEAQQGAVYRIIFYHVPAAWCALLGFLVAAGASVHYLWRRHPASDGLAAAVTEVGLVFAVVNVVTGMIWGRIIWGIWWTWDARLTSMLVCCLLYSGYLIVRQAIEEPEQRARIAAVYSIFAFVDVPIVWFSIAWWRTQHPQPVVWGGGSMDPAMYRMLMANWIPLVLLFASLTGVRYKLERAAAEASVLRRRVADGR